MPTVSVTRRQFVSALAAGAITAAVPAARAADTPPKWRNYSKLTVIDALGGPGSANNPGKTLLASELADVRASGITA
ncbi:MAG TPA: hypothetical protein VFL30_02020, partial [Rhodanobacteraceae bacterium]|nr:hypothetical protein [Rhodanobacteraceae bacterium]